MGKWKQSGEVFYAEDGGRRDETLHRAILENSDADALISHHAIERAIARGLSREEAERLYGSSRSAFEKLLYDFLIPEFCSDPKRLCHDSGFSRSSVKVSEQDARYFLMAWHSHLIEHQGRGLYRAANSAASEQFFWQGRRTDEGRTFTLWLEPVITVAGLARLHFDYGWPKHLIGTQSVDWAFDLVTFLPGQSTEFIAGEVKKTDSELDELIRLMKAFGQNPATTEPAAGKARNAFKKVTALRLRRAPLFWALGPGGLSRMFEVSYGADDVLDLLPIAECALRFPEN